jgi:uncharacterized membrane protein YidH (DUF202 family)
MTEISDKKKSEGVRNRRVHMANERTFLAWIRTSIGIMAFGFVVERFAIFVKQFSFYVGTSSLPASIQEARKTIHESSPQMGYSSLFGILLVGMGALMGFLAFVRYKKVERQIEEDTYRPSRILDMLLALTVLAVGIFMIIYLYHSL